MVGRDVVIFVDVLIRLHRLHVVGLIRMCLSDTACLRRLVVLRAVPSLANDDDDDDNDDQYQSPNSGSDDDRERQ